MFFKTDFPPPPAHARGFDVLSYDLDLILDPDLPLISGQVDIALQAMTDQLQLVHLDLVQNMECQGVSSQGHSLFFEHRGDSLLVHLQTPLAAAQVETLTIGWQGRPLRHGSFRSGLMFRKHEAGTLYDPSDDIPIIANVSETWSAHSWWPCKDHPSDKAQVSLRAAVPDTLSLVSNGVLETVESLEPGWRTYQWREAYPLPTYLVSVAASNYVSWSEDCEVHSASGPDHIIPLGFHVFPQDVLDAQSDLAITCQAMQFMTDLAGDYPFAGEKYDQAEIKWVGAMEHPTATSLPMLFFTGTGRFETLLVHELSHHWFGNSLTPALWQDIWLNEGFARYCEALWLEQTRGPEAYADFMHQIGIGTHENLFLGDGLLANPNPILPNLLVYDKGAWVLHSLRLLLGDDDFFTLLHDYANDPGLKHGHCTTADFIKAAENQAGRSLTGFFQPWLETETVARLHTATTVEPEGQIGAVKLEFQQLQAGLLELAIPVEFHCQSGVLERTFLVTRRRQVFSFQTHSRVDSVLVDPQELVFGQKATAAAPALEVRGPWPNPVSPSGADFPIYLLADSEVVVNFFDSRGRRVHRGEPGRLAATGASTEPDSSPFIWHWTPDQTQGLAAGIYWLEFRAGEHRCVKKMAFVH